MASKKKTNENSEMKKAKPENTAKAANDTYVGATGYIAEKRELGAPQNRAKAAAQDNRFQSGLGVGIEQDR